MNVGAAIRMARIEAGYSQDGLAYLAAMPRQYISKIERQQLIPKLEQIVRIAVVLGVTTSELIFRAEQIESAVIPASSLPLSHTVQ